MSTPFRLTANPPFQKLETRLKSRHEDIYSTSGRRVDTRNYVEYTDRDRAAAGITNLNYDLKVDIAKYDAGVLKVCCICQIPKLYIHSGLII